MAQGALSALHCGDDFPRLLPMVLSGLVRDGMKSRVFIEVSTQDGVDALSGTVDGHAKKLAAEDAAKRVAGIAAGVIKAFKWNWEIPHASRFEILNIKGQASCGSSSTHFAARDQAWDRSCADP